MLCMVNETIIFKDGKEINREVTYLEPILSDGILKHKIRTCNITDFLVGGILLSSLDIPDIATIPFTLEQYAVDLPKLTESKLKQISKLQSLNSNQQEFMEVHYKLSHLSLPAMITLAEKEELRRNLQNSSIGLQFACIAFSVRLIANHGVIKVQKDQSEMRATMLPVNASVWINWYRHNRD
jgi:hypothetical protein